MRLEFPSSRLCARRLNALNSDRIKNADQLVTADVYKFSTALAEIYSNIAKPTVDVILFNYQLSRHVGAEGLLALVILVQGSAAARR